MDVFILIIHFKLPQALVHFKNSVSATGWTEEHCIDFFSRLRFSSLCFLRAFLITLVGCIFDFRFPENILLYHDSLIFISFYIHLSLAKTEIFCCVVFPFQSMFFRWDFFIISACLTWKAWGSHRTWCTKLEFRFDYSFLLQTISAFASSREWWIFLPNSLTRLNVFTF